MTDTSPKAPAAPPDILLPAVLAHELRSPLGAVQGFAALMASEAYGPMGDERYVEAARQMEAACHHMEDLIASVLQMAREKTDDSQLDEKKVDVSDLLNDAQIWLQNKIVDARVVVRLRVSLDPIYVYADERRLRQAVLNVLDNAIRYTPAGGYVDVEAVRREDQGVDICVCNDAPRLECGRLEAKASKSMTGQGLGLYITRAQMAAHGGSVRLIPDGRGRTNAVLSLPADRTLT